MKNAYLKFVKFLKEISGIERVLDHPDEIFREDIKHLQHAIGVVRHLWERGYSELSELEEQFQGGIFSSLLTLQRNDLVEKNGDTYYLNPKLRKEFEQYEFDTVIERRLFGNYACRR
jgi:hypothetical protein